MSQPTPSDVHIDAALTNVSVAYTQDAAGFIADKVFPIIPVDKQSNKYWKYNKGSFFKDEAKRRAPGTESAGSGFGLGTDTYFCDKWALHKDVDDDSVANQDGGIDLFRDAALFCQENLLIRRERLFVENYLAISIWGTTVVGGTNFAKWDDEATSDPAEDIKVARLTILANTGRKPNSLTVDIYTHEALKKHPLIQARFYGNNGTTGTITEQMLAAYFEVTYYNVAAAVYASSDESHDDAPTLAFIAPKCALLSYRAPTPSLMMPSAGYIFAWKGLTGLNNAGITTSRFRMQNLKSERVENEMSMDMKLVASDCGYYFSDTVS
jgi:hypothetical protein